MCLLPKLSKHAANVEGIPKPAHQVKCVSIRTRAENHRLLQGVAAHGTTAGLCQMCQLIRGGPNSEWSPFCLCHHPGLIVVGVERLLCKQPIPMLP